MSKKLKEKSKNTQKDSTFNVEYNRSKQTDQEEDNSQEAEVEEE